MGKVVHLRVVREFVSKTPVFRVRDVELIVKNRAYALLLLHNLAKRGEIHRIVRGWYSTDEDPTFSVYAFRPAYLGLQEALSLHGLWSQETNVVLVTPRRVRPGLRLVLGGKVLVHRIEPGRFFGFDYAKYDGLTVPVSDVEKTLIDLVYFNEIPGRDVLAAIKRRVYRPRLERYLRSYPEAFRRRVRSAVGYLPSDLDRR